MLRTMRENTKWIMLITAIAFIALMVFEWGMDLSGQGSISAASGEIGRVNGKAIRFDEYQTVYQNLLRQRQEYSSEPITRSQEREIEQLAWDQIVMERLIQEEIKRRGLEATAAEIRQAARYAPPPEFYGNPLFQTDGRFDLAKYQQFLASPAVDDALLLELESYYRNIISRNKLYQQVTSGIYASDDELWQSWRDQNDKARIRYVVMSPEELVPDGAVTVTDREIAAFYQSHKKDFVRPARASVRVAVLPKLTTAADTAAARDRALKIRDEILAGADFAEVARRESADPGSASRGGDLGTFSRGQMVPAFEQAVWSAKLNTVTEPVLTNYGYHLIRVTKRTNDEATASHILIPIQRSEETEDALLTAADSLEKVALSSSLTAAAEQLGLTVRTVEITPELPLVAGIGTMDEGADWAFDQTTELNDLSPLFETRDNFYILELVERSPAGTLTLEEATPGIRDRLTSNKRLDEAVKVGQEIVAEIKRTSLGQVASTKGFIVRETEDFTRADFVPGIGQANAVVGAAFGTAPGKTSDLLQANGLLYVIETVAHTPADREAFEAEKETFRARYIEGMQQQRWSQFLTSLKENAKIVDNRSKVLVPSSSVAQR